jgi:hypothetical protein
VDSAGLILKTLRTDFDLAKVPISERDILKKMDELLASAIKDITKGKL